MHVYIMVHASSTEEEDKSRMRINDLIPNFPPHRVLSFSLEVGKTAIVRQVIPSLLVEHDRTFCMKLKPHVKKIVWVDGGSPSVEVSGGSDDSERTHLPPECPTVKSVSTAPAQHNVNHESNGLVSISSLGDVLTLSLN